MALARSCALREPTRGQHPLEEHDQGSLVAVASLLTMLRWKRGAYEAFLR
jgi:hypothetical protein